MRTLEQPAVGHLREVMHDSDGLCFVCDSMGGGRAVQAHLGLSKPRNSNLWVNIGLAGLGVAIGFCIAVVVSVRIWG